MELCRKCNGARTMTRTNGDGRYLSVSCPRCQGKGHEPDAHPYYVIWHNRERHCIELHKPNCEHGMNMRAESENIVNIGGDKIAPREMVMTLPKEFHTMAMMIEDCLR